ncbi:DUF3592 domain-containing protein [Streptomyces sp. SID3343]|uniref:DUF3592 domain-containing protein n=1 Tax=Streptomyces sp. SID3343 TaxID=2690260 RepID=UPI00136FF32C|nr:DUF3592 domain-containing protein [Streptomyces sp. SID3343]MYW01120.1 DUF3592 domain-containing protein [Streptomyces sp. SID3343]
MIPLILGSFVLIIGVRNIGKTRKLRRTGAMANGEVIRHSHSSSDSGQKLHSPIVAWQTPEGSEHEYCPSMHRSGKGRFKLGTRVVIYYDPADPDRAILKGYDGGFGYWLFAVFGAVVFGIGLFLLATVPQGGSF